MRRLIDADVFEERLMANIGLTNWLYRSLKETPTIDALYVCDRKKCEHCNPMCDFTSDIEHAGTTDKVFIIDNVTRWIPCSERLPEEGQVVLVIMGKSHKLDWEEQRFIEFGRISSDRYDCSGTGWEWLNESAADFWEPDWNNRVIAWMPIPAYEEADHE